MTNNPFDDALDDLRVSGNVLLREAYAPPWAIDVPDAATLRRVMQAPDNVHVIPFHNVAARAPANRGSQR